MWWLLNWKVNVINLVLRKALIPYVGSHRDDGRWTKVGDDENTLSGLLFAMSLMFLSEKNIKKLWVLISFCGLLSYETFALSSNDESSNEHEIRWGLLEGEKYTSTYK